MGCRFSSPATERPNYFKSITNEAAREQARRENVQVVTPQDNELFIDLDCEEALSAFLEQIDRFDEAVRNIAGHEVRPSKSGVPGRYHAVVRLEGEPLTHEERIMFQLMLGSDRTREILSYARLALGEEHPTLFFERKGYDDWKEKGQPTTAEMEAALGDQDETFIERQEGKFLGGTVRRCRHCSLPQFGGPNACVPCAESPARLLDEVWP